MLNPLFDIVKKEIDDSHYYFVDGEFYPGVTTILDEAAPMEYGLRRFFKENSQEEIDQISKTSLEFGSKMHDAYEKLMNGLTLNLKEDYPKTKEKKHIASVVAWARLEKQFGFKVIETETVIASKTYKYAGTMDLLCEIDGKLTIVDFKTSSAIRTSYFWQLEAYKRAVWETFGVEVEQCAILRTGTRSREGFEYKFSDKSFDDFKRIYDTYLSLHGGVIPKPPMIDVYPDTIAIEEVK